MQHTSTEQRDSSLLTKSSAECPCKARRELVHSEVRTVHCTVAMSNLKGPGSASASLHIIMYVVAMLDFI